MLTPKQKCITSLKANRSTLFVSLLGAENLVHLTGNRETPMNITEQKYLWIQECARATTAESPGSVQEAHVPGGERDPELFHS